jgi:hypothetical protein
MASQIDNRAPAGSLFKKPGEYKPKGKNAFKTPREHNPTHLEAIRQCPCVACGEDMGRSEAAHVRQASAAHGKRATGMGEKPDDKFVIPLCKDCHRDQHRVGELTFWHRIELSPFLICERLHAASPDIEAMREICFGCRPQVIG